MVPIRCEALDREFRVLSRLGAMKRAASIDNRMALFQNAWLERLKAFLAIGYKIVLLITISLGLASVFVISNMVRMAIESRREEIVVIKLVGGSNAFIRRPFLYIGLWYGFGGGIFAGNSPGFQEENYSPQACCAIPPRCGQKEGKRCVMIPPTSG